MEGISKRKKSGAQNKHAKQARLEEREKLSKQMSSFLISRSCATDTPDTKSGHSIATDLSVSDTNPSIATAPSVGESVAHFLDAASGTFDPAVLINLRLNVSDKELVIKAGAYQPSLHVLSRKKTSFGKNERYCSEDIFSRSDKTQRHFLSYSTSKDALYCLPCVLFSDSVLRGENVRVNQGKSFAHDAFCNWKKTHICDEARGVTSS